jgi:hypothetical protein
MRARRSAILPAPRQWPIDEEWQLAKKYGQRDLVIQSEPYTRPARGQDVRWKPVNPIPIDEPCWVRAVEIRPSSPAGRRTTHHAIAHLEQNETLTDEPDAEAGLAL